MLKIAAIVSLMLIAWPPSSQADGRRYKKDAALSAHFAGSTLWAAGLSCESCGRECAAACGTRHFRSCCFNYLRRKRVGVAPTGELNKIWPPTGSAGAGGMAEEHPRPMKKVPIFAIEDVPAPWTSNVVASDFEPYPLEDNFESRLPIPFEK